MKIAILDDYQDAVRQLPSFKLLAGHDVLVFNDTPAELELLAARLADAEALVLIRERTHITEALLAKLPKLKVISQTGRLGTHVDLEACTRRGVAVLEGTGSPVAPAELTWALIMAAQRRLPQYMAELRAGRWQQSIRQTPARPPNFGLGQVLRGQTLGIWGYGKIGRLVAGFGRAFGMKVLAWGREGSKNAAREAGGGVAGSLEQLLEESDVLSLHLRLNADTRGIVRAEHLARMKPTAVLVNTSRAELIQPGALESALRRGRPGMAAVDVFEGEPIRADHPLLALDNAICTPHLGYVERESYELYFGAAFRNLLAFVDGDLAPVANREVLAIEHRLSDALKSPEAR